MKNILVTGGTGYIGSHGSVELLKKGYNVIIVDNLSNSSEDVVDKIERISNKKPIFYKIDVRDFNELEKVFIQTKIDTVIHFAGAKAVGESCNDPFYYYKNNIIGSINLFELMDKYHVPNIIFSSSATVYRTDEKVPFTEKGLTGNTTNPYGTTKFILENILRDLSNHKGFNVINLRYFNPIGAHNSGIIGENPNGIPNNLLPFIMKVAIGELQEVSVFGADYPTKDGTGERDYIHVVDLIEGHIKALEFLEGKTGVYEEINLGTGKPTSVLEMIELTRNITKKAINYSLLPRRIGDIAMSFCNPKKAKDLLGWEAKYSPEDGIRDSFYFMKSQKADTNSN